MRRNTDWHSQWSCGDSTPSLQSADAAEIQGLLLKLTDGPRNKLSVCFTAHPVDLKLEKIICFSSRLRALPWVFVCVCGLWEYNPGNLGGGGRLRVSPDWLCHLLISCHGELVGPSLLEVCPRGAAGMPRWACWGFVLEWGGYSVCVCVVKPRDLNNSHSCSLHFSSITLFIFSLALLLALYFGISSWVGCFQPNLGENALVFMHTPTPRGAAVMGIVNKLSKLIELWNPLHSPWICLLILSSLISLVFVLSLFLSKLKKKGVAVGRPVLLQWLKALVTAW